MAASNKRRIHVYIKTVGDMSSDIVQMLRTASGNSGIKLPKYISFYITDNTLTIDIREQECVDASGYDESLNATCNNMQTDNAAFEGWAVCLKAWLPECENVRLKWDIPTERNKHYNRFLYRVLRFSEAFPSWFSVSDENMGEVEGFAEDFTGLRNNSFSKAPELKIKHGGDFGETEMEFKMVNEFSSILRNHYGIDTIDRQLPIGVKKDGKQYFTGGLSAIDLWGLGNDSISVIELKYNGGKHSNRKVGIISELFLYSCVIRDIIIGVISAPQACPKLSEKAFYENSCNITSVRAEMLSNGYHPLLENNFILELLNCNAFCDVPVTFGKSSYSYSETNSSLIINRD